MEKILFIHPNNDYTGSTRVLADVISRNYKNSTINIITRDLHGILSELPNVNIIPIYYFQIKGKDIPIITSILWRIHACILVFFYGLSHKTFYINTIIPFYAAIIGKLLNKEIIYHVHEYFIIKSSLIKLSEFVFKKIEAKRIYVSKYLQSCYEKEPHFLSIVAYNRLSDEYKSHIRIKELNKRQRNSIIMICSLNKHKGLSMFIYLAKELPQYNFSLIISEKEEIIYDYLYNECDCIELPTNLLIYPTQSNIHKFLYNSDLMLNLTDSNHIIETFGMTILEAMAYGIPSIVPNVGGPTELIENGYNGFCVDVTNIDVLKTSINKILNKTEYPQYVSNTLTKYSYFQ